MKYGVTLPENTPSRRRFLGAVPAAVATVATAGGSLASAATAPAPIEVMKVGVFGLDYSFWGSIWADLLCPNGRLFGTSTLRMRPTHVWDKDKQKAQQFAKKWECEVVDRYDGMVGKVDGVINGGLYNVPWQHLIMRPYLEAGIPCYLQRPWSNNIRNMDEMLELAAKHSTPIIATTTFEHFNEAKNFSERLKSVGAIQAVFGTAEVSDRPHFHLPYMLLRILGYDVEAVNMITNDPKKIRYMNVNYVYPSKESRSGFVVSMHAARPDVFTFTIFGDRGTASAGMPAGSDFHFRFFDQLRDIQMTFDKREHYQPLDIVRKKFELVRAEYYSHFERGGSPVKIGSVPQDWSIPAWMPGWYEDSEFKR